MNISHLYAGQKTACLANDRYHC